MYTKELIIKFDNVTLKVKINSFAYITDNEAQYQGARIIERELKADRIFGYQVSLV